MLPAIHKNHRHPVTVSIEQIGPRIDIDLLPADPDIIGHPSDRDSRVLTEMAAGPGHQGDPDASPLTAHGRAPARAAPARNAAPAVRSRAVRPRPSKADLSK